MPADYVDRRRVFSGLHDPWSIIQDVSVRAVPCLPTSEDSDSLTPPAWTSEVTVDHESAEFILIGLLGGVDATTGEIIDHPTLNRPEVIRSLALAIHTLQRASRAKPSPDSSTKTLQMPPRAGESWTPEEDARLLAGWNEGGSVASLAQEHERTRGAIRSRLDRHAIDHRS